MIALKAAIVLFCACAGTVPLRRWSASLRHAVLATGFAIVCLLPLLERAAPGWGLSATPHLAGLSTSALIETGIIRAVWYGGAAAGLLTIVVGLARIAWIGASSRPIDARRQAIADDAASDLRIRRAVTVLETDRAIVPMTWGLFRPKIMVPAAARRWSDDCLRDVLRHELAHIQRGDWAVQLVVAMLTRIFWFNPMAWLAARQLRLESERACDDAVLNLGVDGTEYADHLIRVARAVRGGTTFARFALVGDGRRWIRTPDRCGA